MFYCHFRHTIIQSNFCDTLLTTFLFQNGKMQKLSSKNKSDVFVSADEFAEMLEETGASDFKVGSISNVSNKDNAGLYYFSEKIIRQHLII